MIPFGTAHTYMTHIWNLPPPPPPLPLRVVNTLVSPTQVESMLVASVPACSTIPTVIPRAYSWRSLGGRSGGKGREWRGGRAKVGRGGGGGVIMGRAYYRKGNCVSKPVGLKIGEKFLSTISVNFKWYYSGGNYNFATTEFPQTLSNTTPTNFIKEIESCT